ncbi:DUF4129 domain-containing protein, partial [Haloferax profundi]|uniref:DUF4129 domain-containing protein n=1 Tax=Haloferax profundi TaxID=1544718 RepID=UPI000B06A57C
EAKYDPQKGNLNGSSASVQLELPKSSDNFGFDLLSLIGVAIGVVILGIGGVFIARATGSEPKVLSTLVASLPFNSSQSVDHDETSSSEGSVDTSQASETQRHVKRKQRLQLIETRLENGQPDATVIGAYELLRGELKEVLENDSSLTHWEFVRHVQDKISEDDANAVRELTESYEIAAFAPDSVSEGRARRAFEIAKAGIKETD